MVRLQTLSKSLIAAAALVLSATAGATIKFAPAVNIATGAYSGSTNPPSFAGPGPAPTSSVSADINNDGRPDVINANWWGTGFTIMLNNGNGNFTPLPVPVSDNVQSVAAADVNGDGKVDVVYMTGFQIVTLLGNGAGSFKEASRYSYISGGQEQSLIADFNRDGKPDLAIVSLGNGGGIQVMLGKGDGTFSNGPFTGTLGVVDAAAVANLNNDGIPDLMVLSATTGFSPVSEIYPLVGKGDGSFTAKSPTPFGGIISEDIAVGDLNGDGIDDVVTANSFSFNVTVLLSNPSGGYTQAGSFNGGAGPVSIDLADLDGDGKLDIVEAVVGQAIVQVFPGLGGGNFGPVIQLSVAPFPQSPVLDKFYGSGKLDLVVSGPTQMSVLRNISTLP